MQNNTKKVKPKKVRVRKLNINNTVRISPSFMSEDEMQHLIAKAIVEAEEIKEQKNKEREEAERNRWCELIGYKDYSSEKLIPRVIKTAGNYIVRIIKLFTLSNKDIRGERVTTALLKLCLSSVFGVVKTVLFVLAISLLCYCIAYCYVTPGVDWIYIALNVVFAFMLLFFSRVFHIAEIEVEDIKDKNYLLGFFAAVISLVSLAVAIISIKQGGIL